MIAQLIGQEEQGQIDLVYFDESSFYRKPGVNMLGRKKEDTLKYLVHIAQI
jgi:hypothetical protein